MTPREIVEHWAAAYNARDAVAAAKLYREDASNWQLAIGDPVVGQAAIRDNLAAFFRAFPDSVIRTEELLATPSEAAWTWVASGTWSGPFAGLEPNGKAYALRGCTFFEIVDGRISAQRAYWDKATWFRQLGIPL